MKFQNIAKIKLLYINLNDKTINVLTLTSLVTRTIYNGDNSLNYDIETTIVERFVRGNIKNHSCLNFSNL